MRTNLKLGSRRYLDGQPCEVVAIYVRKVRVRAVGGGCCTVLCSRLKNTPGRPRKYTFAGRHEQRVRREFLEVLGREPTGVELAAWGAG